MRDRSQRTIDQILTTFGHLKQEIAVLEALVQQVIITEMELDQEDFVEATVLQEDEILFDGIEVVESARERAKTKKEKLLEGRVRAREWAKSLLDERKKASKEESIRRR
jgi:hypothetical protein